jgi:threonine dehydrogenase-like Zn-dependent dehydrogenase
MSVFWKELDIAGARVYRREDFEEAVELLADSAIPADSLITDIVPLEDTAAGIARLESGDSVVKLLIDSRQ